MNKKSIVITSIILLTILGSGIVLLNTSGTETKFSQQSPAATESMQTSRAGTAPTTTTEQAGAYIDYKDNTIAATPGTKLLFFHAPWCSQCRELEADIKRSGVPSGVTIIKVDYDSNQKLRQKYGVTLQTTFVKVNDEGDLIERFVAYSEPTLDSVVKNLL